MLYTMERLILVLIISFLSFGCGDLSCKPELNSSVLNPPNPLFIKPTEDMLQRTKANISFFSKDGRCYAVIYTKISYGFIVPSIAEISCQGQPR